VDGKDLAIAYFEQMEQMSLPTLISNTVYQNQSSTSKNGICNASINISSLTPKISSNLVWIACRFGQPLTYSFLNYF
jgi:hypothetical protein